ncbi:MAG: DUF1553 domain-containing protein [Verrucomicrobia bacterium]|nr:DUF1553 domain-containing protein [Verrucomicrobiota bacterium]
MRRQPDMNQPCCEVPIRRKFWDSDFAPWLVDAALSWLLIAVEPLAFADSSVADSWWSLQPLQTRKLPAVENTAWPRTPVDRFILAKLQEQNLAPAPEADKSTLLRRVTFDLTGLPPTPEELQGFLADPSAGAYEKVVDRLLNNPRYGERWARHWLDVVHYADTHGHDQDRPRTNSWPYRDYVVRAFNEDKPYAHFVEEQLAGDVLYPGDPNGVIATGFIATGPWDESSQMHIMADTVDKKIAQNLDRDDIVTTAMSTFVSSTVHCARCHDHKFDPISQREYYGLQAVFAGVDRTDRPFDWDAQIHRERQMLLKTKTAIEVRRMSLANTRLDAEIEEALAAGQAAWEARIGEAAPIWTVLDPESFTSRSGATIAKQPDLSLLVSGTKPEIDSCTIVARPGLSEITAIRLEVLPDDSLPQKGPGRQDNGNFHLSEFQVKAGSLSEPGKLAVIELRNATADFNQKDWEIAKAVDGKTNTAWGIHPEVGKSHVAVFECKQRLNLASGERLTFVLEQLHGRSHLLGRFRLSVTAAPWPVRADPLPENIARIAGLARGDRTKEEQEQLTAHYQTISPELQRLLDEIDEKLAKLPKPNLVYAAAHDFKPQGKFTPAKVPRPIYVLGRGEVTRPGQPVLPGTISCVAGLPSSLEIENLNDEASRRAALAKWITDPRNGLTWRSIVNRVWHYHFGRGIVDTPNDFGRMGSGPTHPELLDWLAIFFRDRGGSLKKLHRLLVTSAVYRQSSQHDPKFAKIDSDNRFLWRMNRSRLDAESLRDAILCITGKLDLKMGGHPVKQFHFEDPDPGVTPKVDYGRFDVDSPESYRRSVYRWIFRTLPDPFMEAMDCPDSSLLAPTRNSSVTALQALAMLNNRFIVRQSEHFAERLRRSRDGLVGQIELAYELAFGRRPTAQEAKELAGYAQRHDLPNACRLILNSSEFAFVN